MSKLCCFPLNEPPEVNVKVHCISSCCASDLKTKDEDPFTMPENVPQVKHSNTTCCGKKRKRSKSHAKEKEQANDSQS